MATGRVGAREAPPSPPQSPISRTRSGRETSIRENSCPILIPARSPNPAGPRGDQLPAFHSSDRANQKFRTSKSNRTRMSKQKYTGQQHPTQVVLARVQNKLH
ncbi:hypothetical protein GQ55_8G160600 [Panicum hallii var. hallii]|uniref:Uncharacterized protein n=1 Tax=Panicum hallii var. hallii TaxID=1504633 RepID=A0A2T7CNA3_9POAL|nr:hypothetical protein GQ55_8G160600 [Panicum hallii var. hallii]